MKTDQELSRLRVPGSYDQYTATRHMFSLADTLSLSATQCKQVVTSFQTMWFKHRRYKPSRKEHRKQILFILRWMNRGLTLSESIRKLELEVYELSRRNANWRYHRPGGTPRNKRVH